MEKHTDGCICLERYAFLVVFYCDSRYRWTCWLSYRDTNDGHTAHYVKTSSTKLHKARGEPTEPWPQATCSFPKSGFEVSEISEQTVKHSNRQTDIGLLITILCIPLGDRVKMQCFTPVTALNRERLKVWGQTNYETSNEAGKVTLGSPNLRSSLLQGLVDFSADFQVSLFPSQVMTTNSSDSQI